MPFSPRSPLRVWMGSRIQSRRVVCDLCGIEYSARGIHRHRISCQQKLADAFHTAQFEAEILSSRVAGSRDDMQELPIPRGAAVSVPTTPLPLSGGPSTRVPVTPVGQSMEDAVQPPQPPLTFAPRYESASPPPTSDHDSDSVDRRFLRACRRVFTRAPAWFILANITIVAILLLTISILTVTVVTISILAVTVVTIAVVAVATVAVITVATVAIVAIIAIASLTVTGIALVQYRDA
ncbi:hypothetical protein PYCCODRAFT_1468268 [Trametes coccinea BRFM310]|uniref:Uncharacterized protein n=1 Tax=Trametes coccinea (strain BRFM310) TaxID=1353009 RepID=A0A1Y2ILJ7_TRAC3|nr:hypothetical protein PYCCODRAFT_1468268 [Trametes coccinea BRFM310]